MNNLLNFFVKHSSWFIFIIYVVLSCVMLFRDNPYQQSVYLTSANSVTTTVYEGMSAVTSYFHLKDINADLQERNALLEHELVALRDELNNTKLLLPDSTQLLQPRLRQFDYVVAHVISNSIAQPNNYITINRGSLDGIKPEMGVVDQNGVVGIVNVVGRHSARIISLLNPHMRLSCKLKSSEYFGSMVWDGRSPEYAYLEGLPKHVQFAEGDTIVTSGYSAVFPEGIIVGTIEGKARDDSESFVALKVKLTTNFSQLSTVRVMTNNLADELKSLTEGEGVGESPLSTPKTKEDRP
ncbi:MAG: rod shape-determining protein MreC [Muribaculaceae bacterium]|nr:rod shape-determining protein MreC [Muribaculaceae bacterium]